MVQLMKPTVSKEHVPLLFHEPHVLSGFRHIHQPWTYYFLSLFQIHNECLNSWTHLIAMLLVIKKMMTFSKEFSLFTDPYMWPLTSGIISIVILYLCSSLAHCLQSRSELAHYTCFMFDYAGIGLYGIGSIILHYNYCMLPSFNIGILQSWIIPVGVILGVCVCLCCSISKVRYKRPYPFIRKVWQLGSVGGIYALLILPIAHRVLLMILTSEWDKGLPHHIEQMIWFIMAGFFFGSDIPQRFFPGKFDFLGHSHQLFHICIMMVSWKQLDGIYEDIVEWKTSLYEKDPPTFSSTFGAIFLTIFINLIVVVIFTESAKQFINQGKSCERKTDHISVKKKN
ncbi:membrane progestin receptor beta-like [Octopus vulgaris]|uniref:Membrane progestin receptor beta-like n=1 Tax=Octopus vulgaris TaxID=6645 RepID=A0AA36B599_OCTVU|nr:membrane progestin receptor beta-like [Octopus vulgaris]